MPLIYHLTTRDAWGTAQAAGIYDAPSLAEEGFIHCSGDLEQMLRVAARLYRGHDDLLALDVETELLNAPVKVEPSGSGELYPHIYGKLNLDAVVQVRELLLDPEGTHTL